MQTYILIQTQAYNTHTQTQTYNKDKKTGL